jgi:predicted O-methyltransferase YrrM
MIYTKNEIESIWEESVVFKIQQKKYEWVSLLDLLNNRESKFKNGLEIGAYDGGSSMSLGFFCDNLITIDGNNPIRFNTQTIKEKTSSNYTAKSANSFHTETIQTVKDFSPNGFDLIFIDGDHTYDGVKKDFENYSPMLKDGGVIFFHDIVDSEYHRSVNCYVSKFWEETKKNFNYVEILDPKNHDWGGIGVIIK